MRKFTLTIEVPEDYYIKEEFQKDKKSFTENPISFLSELQELSLTDPTIQITTEVEDI